MNAKQWIKDYVDFAMPLIIVVVALNLVDLLIDLPISANGLHLYSLIFLGSALFIRFFTSRLVLTFNAPFALLFCGYFIHYGFVNNNAYRESFGAFFSILFGILFFALMIFLLFCIAFRMIRIFFTNFHTIKNIVYIVISILYLTTLLIYKFGTPNMFLIAKWILLISIFSLIIISILYYYTFSLFVYFKKDIIINKPLDIKEWDNDIKLEADAWKEAQKEQRKRDRIINDIADAVRRKL